MPEEKRCHKRYPVSGKTLFQTESQEATGELVDIARALYDSYAVTGPAKRSCRDSPISLATIQAEISAA